MNQEGVVLRRTLSYNKREAVKQYFMLVVVLLGIFLAGKMIVCGGGGGVGGVSVVACVVL